MDTLDKIEQIKKRRATLENALSTARQRESASLKRYAKSKSIKEAVIGMIQELGHEEKMIMSSIKKAKNE